jgi:hypothetical protein
MKLKDLVLGAAGRKLNTFDEEQLTPVLQQPASHARIVELERKLGFALPPELREILTLAAGLDLVDEGREVDDPIRFDGIERCGHEELFGWVLMISTDGAGNDWVIELRPDQQVLGPVWFLCHDARVLVYQSPDLATFLADNLRYLQPPHDGPIEHVVEHAVHEVWAQELDLPRNELLESPDPLLRTFANALPEGWFVRDLRRAKPGDGMPIGRFGPQTPLARAGDEFVFAYGSRSRLQRLKTFFTGK